MFRLLGSLKIAVPLLIAIAAVLAWGTIYETRFGTASVQRFIYQAWWFQTLLAFLGVNLAVAAGERFPWKRRHIPFVLAHLGIILLLIGGIVGGRWGVDGQLMIPEGQTSGLLQLPFKVLVVHDPHREDAGEVIQTNFETTAWNHQPHRRFEVPLKDRSVQLSVDEYYPNAAEHEEVQPGGSRDYPAIRMAVFHEQQQESAWLFAEDPQRFGARWGEAHLFFLRPASDKELEQLVKMLPPQSILVAQGPAGQLSAVLKGAGAGEQKKIQPLALNTRYAHPWLQYQFEVQAHLPQARIQRHFENTSNDVRKEVLRVVAREQGQTAEGWLPVRDSTQLSLPGGPLVVEYRQALQELPFAVHLLDFRKTDYPGTQMAAGFESDVEVIDEERGNTFQRKISMNNPLKYRGYTLFQSSFIAAPTEITVLSVRNDPGTPLVYSGFLIIVAGVVSLFVFRELPGVAL